MVRGHGVRLGWRARARARTSARARLPRLKKQKNKPLRGPPRLRSSTRLVLSVVIKWPGRLVGAPGCVRGAAWAHGQKREEEGASHAGPPEQPLSAPPLPSPPRPPPALSPVPAQRQRAAFCGARGVVAGPHLGGHGVEFSFFLVSVRGRAQPAVPRIPFFLPAPPSLLPNAPPPPRPGPANPARPPGHRHPGHPPPHCRHPRPHRHRQHGPPGPGRGRPPAAPDFFVRGLV